MNRMYCDISEYNIILNYETLANTFAGAFIRAGFGRGHADKRRGAHYLGCAEYDIPVGYYWMSYAYTREMAEREADYLISAIDGWKADLPLVWDFENDSIRYAQKNGVNVTKELQNEMARAFCAKIESAGFYAMIYSGADDYINRYDLATKNRYDFWLAYYPEQYTNIQHLIEPISTSSKYGNAVNNAHLWQYSSSYRNAEISKNNSIDVSVSRIDYRTVIAKMNGRGIIPNVQTATACEYCKNGNCARCEK